ncbi:hypothetical protein [Desulfohalobium retbaense]|uniref:Uncharacterized protein n=1 Tax=Desulfohalobium retbaense (strain ATCC 49708 / DSM 5692 / JCM 16813 / HR100) TaxID=485915 RepID=C8WZK1_DESRD|nr:hypothetical protein [Desulfohalobium retbaense]ACV67476.1 hypothetical protein Dret_0174 [Desulfohalobium retbaense DSM 5692]
MHNLPECHIRVDYLDPTVIMPLYHRGVFLAPQCGTTVQDFLEHTCHLQPDYIRSRIQTIFLDGHPVDDTAHTTLDQDATLALSAAMPGLVGATMRSGGQFAALREGISYTCSPSAAPGSEAPVLVRLKLFNFLAKEVGPDLLQNGVILPRADWVQWLSSADALWPHCLRMTYDGQDLDCSPQTATNSVWPEHIQFRLSTPSPTSPS